MLEVGEVLFQTEMDNEVFLFSVLLYGLMLLYISSKTSENQETNAYLSTKPVVHSHRPMWIRRKKNQMSYPQANIVMTISTTNIETIVKQMMEAV